MKGLAVYIDVGGSFTRVIVRDEAHRELKNISFTTSLQTLKTQVQAALRPYHKPQLLMIGMRGVWTAPEKKRWKKEFSPLGKIVLVMSDVELAHRLVFKNAAGILLNAGTGSIAYGRSPAGRVARSGGLGPLLGDEGSGFWIGRQYLKKIYEKGHDLNTVRKYAKHTEPIATIASLAKKVIKKSEGKNGKEEKALVQEAQADLKKLLNDTAWQLRWEGLIPVKLVGGLFRNSGFKKNFIKILPQNRFKII